MPPLIRLDTSAATLARAATLYRTPSRHSHEPPSRSPATPSSSLTRLQRKVSSAISPVAIPLRRISVRGRPDAQSPKSPKSPRVTFGGIQEIEETIDELPPTEPIPPIDRFRNAVRQIIQMNRMKAMLVASDEPGLDARRNTMQSMYGTLNERCTIDVVDFGPVTATETRLNNDTLGTFLREHKRPSWAHVRWINVTSISWDVISTLALHYDLHPLAVEDIFGGEANTRTKSDYYLQHLFIRLLCHIPRDRMDCEETSDMYWRPTPERDVTSPEAEELTESEEEEEEKTQPLGHAVSPRNKRALRSLAGAGLMAAQPWARHGKEPSWGEQIFPHVPAASRRAAVLRRLSFLTGEARAQAAEDALVEELKKSQRVQVDKRNMYIFLLRDSTVISIHPTAYDTFFAPIMRRIHHPDTLLRAKATGSLLVHAIIDQVVQYADAMVQRFHTQALNFEHHVLTNPGTNIIRDVHIASADLKSHTATLKPILLMVRSLRVNDISRCVALAEDEGYALKNKKNIHGYMTRETLAYLADIEDQISYIIRSLNTYADTEELLLEYIFNFARLGMARSVRIYTKFVVTLLPPIIIAMYFGMNFEPMDSTLYNSEALFWKIAIPTLCGVILIFTYGSIYTRMKEFQKKLSFVRSDRRMFKSVRTVPHNPSL
ncbi:hypothetical protein FRC02_009503 [Tulasnella sp. 418]|nr:hypothetical protein FRC02_009503 [Tulasnella sp. 418]